MLESAFEKTVCKYVKLCGGRAFKWVSPGCLGVPDRICVLPGGRIIFIEVKRPGEKDGLRPRQRKIIDLLRSLGCTVWRIDDKAELIFQLRSLGYEV